jgi:hypothetical protein
MIAKDSARIERIVRHRDRSPGNFSNKAFVIIPPIPFGQKGSALMKGRPISWP